MRVSLRRDRVAALVPWALALVLWPAILSFPWTTDTGEFALVARSWAQGDLLYVDVGSIRPVAQFAVYRLGLAVFGEAHAHVLMELVVQVLTLAGVVHLARRGWGESAALRTGVVYAISAFAYMMPDTIGEAESFCMPLTVAAMMVAERANAAERAPGFLPFALLGVLGAQMAALKIVPVLIAAGAAGWLLVSRRDAGFVRPLAGFAAGFALGLLPWVLLLLPGDGLAAMVDMFTRWKSRASGDVSLFRFFFVVPGLLLGLLYFIPCGILAVLGLVRLRKLAQRGASEGAEGRASGIPARVPLDGLVVVVLASALAVVAAQGKFYSYHFILLVPAMTMLGGRWWQIVRDVSPPAATGVKRFLPAALAAFLVLGPFVRRSEKWTSAIGHAAGWTSREAYLAQFQVPGFTDPFVEERISRRLAEETPPDARILVWGMNPQVPYLADRRPASRFVMHLPYTCRACDPSLRDDLLARLEAKPASRIVVHVDGRNATDVGEKATYGELLARFTALRSLIDEDYELAWRDGSYEVYRPRTIAAP